MRTEDLLTRGERLWRKAEIGTFVEASTLFDSPPEVPMALPREPGRQTCERCGVVYVLTRSTHGGGIRAHPELCGKCADRERARHKRVRDRASRERLAATTEGGAC